MKGRIVQVLMENRCRNISLLSIDQHKSLAPIHMIKCSTWTENIRLDLHHIDKIMATEITIMVGKRRTTMASLKAISELRIRGINSLTAKVVAVNRGGRMSQ